jgi:putative methyltransferase (TIGR04325 family)
MAADRQSTPSWLLPSPIRRFREHLREIRRLTAETQQTVVDVRNEFRGQLGPLQNVVRDHENTLSRIEARIEEFADGRAGGESSPPEWEFVPEGWERARDEDPAGRGWSADQVARAYGERWSEFLAAVEGSGPLGVSHEVPVGSPIERDDPLAQNIVLAWAYALTRAADGVTALSVLDWGGALGHYHVLARKLFPDLELDYHCRELQAVCEEGRRLQPDVVFHEDDSCLSHRFELVLASNSLQYEEDWQGRLRALAGAADGWVFITRVPLVRSHPSFVLLQRAHQYGYGTEYLGWVLNRDELLQAARDRGLGLVREFSLLWPRAIEGAPEPVADGGFLFTGAAERA